MKGDKIVAFCDRNCNVIAPLFREELPLVTELARAIGLDLKGTIVSLDGVYDCRANRKSIFNRGMIPNINANPRSRKKQNAVVSRYSIATFSQSAFKPLNVYLLGKISFVACWYDLTVWVNCIMPLKHLLTRWLTCGTSVKASFSWGHSLMLWLTKVSIYFA